MAAPKLTTYDSREADLIQRAKSRAPEAWTEIYTRHYSPVYRYVHARVYDAETAEDLASNVFLGAIKGIDAYSYRGQPLLAWLYRIARNVVSDHQRELLGRRHNPGRLVRSLFQRSKTEEDSVDIIPASGDSDTTLLVERMDLREALAKLNGSQREIVILRFFVGLSTQEIAGIMGKPPAAIYSQEARAMGALRKHLV